MEARHGEVRPAEVRPAEVRLAEVRPANVYVAKIEIRPAKVCVILFVKPFAFQFGLAISSAKYRKDRLNIGPRSLSGIDSAEAPNMTAFPEGVWA